MERNPQTIKLGSVVGRLRRTEEQANRLNASGAVAHHSAKDRDIMTLSASETKRSGDDKWFESAGGPAVGRGHEI